MQQESTPRCFYCGAVATAKDHTFPVARMRSRKWATGRTIGRMPKGWKLVPACSECNSILGAREFDSMEERKAWVKNHLRRKYQKLLKTKWIWEPEEIAGLGPGLRERIAAMILQRDEILERLAW